AGIWLLIGHTVASRQASTSLQMKGLAHAATTDTLTGLLNRSEFDRVLNDAAPGDAVIVLDLDGFKRINDGSGHDAGDAILAEWGRSILAEKRSRDIAVRFGGDEVLILAAGAGPHGAEALLDRLKIAWSRDGRPTFSGGVAVRRAESPRETFRRADAALYAAKASGRDCWRINAAGEPIRQLRVVR
ncbi:MAG TPA: GGDEF domain-containing protein, partial [Acidimicrobiales bacterium]|nr:GGDEF domain-containing protein [Acidimicrobiales bacterium]